MGEGPIIRVRGLSKSYGPLRVLREMDLDVEQGEKIGIIGASGSGKSTLLRLLMTLERPDAGRIEIRGESMWTVEREGREIPADEAHLRRIRSRLGMVFQHFNLFPHMDVISNVTVGPRLAQGVDPGEAEGIARELLARVGLEDKERAYPAHLSGGQKQRVAIARALACRPEVMLFDEITSALDPELVGEVLNVLRDLARSGEMTMMIVTHQVRFAQEISDRILFLDEGRIVEEGPPGSILSEPREERTRQFLRQILEA